MKKLSIVFNDSDETRGFQSTPPQITTTSIGAESSSTNPPSTK